MKRGGWIAIAIGVAVALGFFGPWRHRDKGPKYRLAAVTRGALESVVSATGTLNPVDQVEVGSQVSGTLTRVNVDYNDRVKKGQVLAQIDPSLFRAALSEANAAIEKARANLADGDRGLKRMEAMKSQGLVSDQEIEAAQLTVASRRADLSSAQASAERARINMQNTTIVSPITGTVIARAVDAGQTVAASLQAPNLFTLARDLSEMELEARVDEADIGQVENGMAVSFTVDAFPDRTFEGSVRQIRSEPVTESGVVSYVVVSRVPNPDQKLLPGMTANVTIVSASRDDALKLPNGALRFRPPGARAGGRRDLGDNVRTSTNGGVGAGAPAGSAAAPGGGGAGMTNSSGAGGAGADAARGTGGRGQWSGRRGGARGDSTQAGGGWRGRGGRGAGGARGDSTGGGGWSGTGGSGNARGGRGRGATVYVLADSSGKQALKPLRVRVGITDGTMTEIISSDELKEGTMVVIGIEEQTGAQRTTTNPFQPASPFGGGRQGGGQGGGGRGQGGGQGGGARGGGGR